MPLLDVWPLVADPYECPRTIVETPYMRLRSKMDSDSMEAILSTALLPPRAEVAGDCAVVCVCAAAVVWDPA
jgi:hypothetical protein